jgi:hypothetical protein
VSLLLIDEAARVEDAVYKSLRPMLAVGKRVSIPSHDTKGLRVNSDRSGVGLRNFRSGAPGVKAAAVCSNADMDYGDRSIKNRMAFVAGSGSG